MTLISIHRTPEKIAFVSDSRVTINKETGEYFDCGIKVTSIPIKVYGPTDTDTRESRLLFDDVLGFALAGNGMNGFLIKEYVKDVMKNVQYSPDYTKNSMDNICELILNVFRVIDSEVKKILRSKSKVVLFVGGFCEESRRTKVFMFYSYFNQRGEIDYTYEEIVVDNQIYFHGSGANEARWIYENEDYEDDLDASLKVVKRICKDCRFSTVGGGLQYGEFTPFKKFELFGVIDKEEVDDFEEYDGETAYEKPVALFRGLNLMDDINPETLSGFNISQKFKNPFGSHLGF